MSAIAQRRTAFAAAIMMLFSVLRYVLITVNASPANAHHPEITASVECVEQGTQVRFRAEAWAYDGDQNRRHNNDVRVTVDGVEVGSGAFTAANGYSFSGSFDAEPHFGQTIKIKVTAVVKWGVGQNLAGAGQTRSTYVKVEEKCEPEPEPEPVTVSVSGTYLFDELDAGNYRVRVCLQGADYTVENALGVADDVDSDVFVLGDGCAMTGLINLPAGVTDLTWDAGVVVEVEGIQIEPTTTTAPPPIEPVTVETLPFTGSDTEQTVLVALGALLAGAALLFLVSGRDEEAMTPVDGGTSWSNRRR